jgi:predicted AAA+ superfamily ATPase
LLNLTTLASQVGLCTPTLKNYLYYAEKTYSIALAPPYFRKLQKEITKAPTPYFIDLGLRNLLLNKWGNLTEASDFGFVFQNLIYHMLCAQYPNTPVKFWRTVDKSEVDFVVEDESSGGIFPVEVKYSALRRPEVTRSLRSFINKYQPKEAWVVNMSLDQVEQIDETTVRFVPLHALL